MDACMYVMVILCDEFYKYEFLMPFAGLGDDFPYMVANDELIMFKIFREIPFDG